MRDRQSIKLCLFFDANDLTKSVGDVYKRQRVYQELKSLEKGLQKENAND